MPPPLSPSEREEMRRLIREVVDERAKPLEQKLTKHSGKFGQVREEVVASRREFSDSQHDIESERMAFERIMMSAVGRLEEQVTSIAKSIPPAAQASQGAEAAAVAGAKASIAGATAAIDSRTNALAAKVSAHRALIAQVLTAVALAVWQLYEHFAK